MFWQLVLSGIAAGSVYALVALGLVLIYKSTDVVNFAQGELVMLGAYFAITFHTIFHIPYLPALALALVATMLAGLIVDLVAIRPIQQESILSIIIATIAVGLILRNTARLVWGPELWPFPPMLSRTPFNVAGMLVTPESLGIGAVTLAFMAVYALFFRRHRIGKAMRAVAENRRAAALVGISVKRIFSVAWVMSALLAGLAGLLLAPLQPASPTMGLIAVTAFAAAIVGGFESMTGAVVGGFLLGVIQNLAGFYVSAVLKDTIAFIIVIAVLVVRPAGLLGRQTVRRV